MLTGLFFCFTLQKMYYYLLRRVCKLERLAALDEFFLLDNDRNRANIITVVKTDRLPDYERLRQLSI